MKSRDGTHVLTEIKESLTSTYAMLRPPESTTRALSRMPSTVEIHVQGWASLPTGANVEYRLMEAERQRR